MTNLYIPICGFFCAILLIICFFSKKRINNMETKLFSLMLITSFLDSIFMIAIIYIAYTAKEQVILQIILNKLDYIQFLLWIWVFFLYIVYISYKDKKIYKHYKKVTTITSFINFIVIIAMIILPVKLYNENNIMYSYGEACNVLYFIACIYIVLIALIITINIKKIFNKKYIPVFIFVFLAVIVLIMKQLKPDLVIVTAALAYVNLIMYFTIENPDIKMLEEITLAKNQSEKANRAKSDFLSSMSHEIRTPLNAIVGLSEDIASYKESVPKEVLEDTEDIINASQTLLEIVGNILDINKIEANKMEIIESPYIFKDEITNMCKVTITRIGEKNITFKLNIAEDIPYELVGDKGKVKEIINNLLTNSIKYTEKGQINLNIKCVNNLNKNISTIIVVCQDTGRGIKKENIDKLFTKFERLDIEKNTTTEGTGLGLAITKSLVEMMGGKINVQSQFGKGSIFMVSIPQKISKILPPMTDEELMNTASKLFDKNKLDGISYGSKKILIVDDNKLNIKVARKALQDFNFEIDECYDGLQCLDKVKEKDYDLILMDIMMPNMGGEATLSKLKENPLFKTPTIALTADAIAGAMEKYCSEGFAGYLAKPFNRNQIKEKLDEIFKTKNVVIDKWDDIPKHVVVGGNKNDINE